MVLAVPNSGAALAADELSEHNGVAEWEAGQERAIEAVYLLPINLLIVRVVVVEYDLQPCACTSSRVAAPLSCLVRTAVEHDRDIHQATHRGGIDNEVLFVYACVVVASYNTESCDALLGLGCLFLVCVCHGVLLLCPGPHGTCGRGLTRPSLAAPIASGRPEGPG